MHESDLSSTIHSSRHLTASAAVFDPTRRTVLLAVHKLTRYYQLPGGHFGPGESGSDAAIREVREETGVQATLWRAGQFDVPGGTWQPSPIMTIEYPAPANPTWNEDPHHHVDLLFLATADSLLPTVPQLEEVDAVRWLPIDALDRPDVRPDMPVIVPIAWRLLQIGQL
ncbi:NUDIX domain-containing protein [Phytohabitans sp. ZYX-F-186]|uniref:NUDIX domain-containing protein n=1 Tax=Phytohabitans maris TaxID=3071409 RepID=A0ABU0ZKL0_9ACTN|nr:NUDIX domain-containing protein [Phytohabitans sp. ZYX-F-186]MDQ7907589.1 NUDIX domain-containing protein [Phytohabitans sp. ZYX-F-186]